MSAKYCPECHRRIDPVWEFQEIAGWIVGVCFFVLWVVAHP